MLMQPREPKNGGRFHHEEKSSVCTGKVLTPVDKVTLSKKKWQQESDTTTVLESELEDEINPRPPRIPPQVQKLLRDVAILELSVLRLEEQALLLKIQIKDELTQRYNLEKQFIKSLVLKNSCEAEKNPASPLWNLHPKGSFSSEWSTKKLEFRQSSNDNDEKLCYQESASELRAYLSPSLSQSKRNFIWSSSIPKHGSSCREQSGISEQPAEQLEVLTSNCHESNGKKSSFQSSKSSQAEEVIAKPCAIPKQRGSHRHLTELNAHQLETCTVNCFVSDGTTTSKRELPPPFNSPGLLPCEGARSSPQEYVCGTPDLSSSPRMWPFWRFLTKEQKFEFPVDSISEENEPPFPDTPISSMQRQDWADIGRLPEQYWKKFATKSNNSIESASPALSLSSLKAGSVKYSSPRISVNKQTSPGSSIRHPCLISEDMVQCMIDIYCYLSDSSGDSVKSSKLGTVSSPASTLGHAASSSFSSVSESSLLSFVRFPTVNLQNKQCLLGSETTYDPYKTYEKVPWADIGVYRSAVEVLWISADKEQLEVAAMALCKYKVFVEELSKADAKSMTNKEKLAFWINIYNALVMHAFLAYGVPKGETKYFSMLQKAAYVVGGRSYSAIAIEFGLLRRKTPIHRPQLALLLAFHRLKPLEEYIIDGIENPEPLMMFALCSGSYSSPAVRVYTAEKVMEQLQESFHDYVRASVSINLRGKLLIPKLVYIYAHGLVEDAALVDWICHRLPDPQSSLIQDCMQQRQTQLLRPKKFKILSFDFRFRYLFLSTARKTSHATVQLRR